VLAGAVASRAFWEHTALHLAWDNKDNFVDTVCSAQLSTVQRACRNLSEQRERMSAANLSPRARLDKCRAELLMLADDAEDEVLQPWDLQCNILYFQFAATTICTTVCTHSCMLYSLLGVCMYVCVCGISSRTWFFPGKASIICVRVHYTAFVLVFGQYIQRIRVDLDTLFFWWSTCGCVVCVGVWYGRRASRM